MSSDQPIIAPPCSRCQRREATISVYAADLVEADARIADLEADNRTLRELLSVALEQLAASTQVQRHLRDRQAALLVQLRGLPTSMRRAA